MRILDLPTATMLKDAISRSKGHTIGNAPLQPHTQPCYPLDLQYSTTHSRSTGGASATHYLHSFPEQTPKHAAWGFTKAMTRRLFAFVALCMSSLMTWLEFAALKQAERANTLAELAYIQAYREDCRAQRDAQEELSEECAKALREPLPALRGSRKRLASKNWIDYYVAEDRVRKQGSSAILYGGMESVKDKLEEVPRTRNFADKSVQEFDSREGEWDLYVHGGQLIYRTNQIIGDVTALYMPSLHVFNSMEPYATVNVHKGPSIFPESWILMFLVFALTAQFGVRKGGIQLKKTS